MQRTCWKYIHLAGTTFTTRYGLWSILCAKIDMGEGFLFLILKKSLETVWFLEKLKISPGFFTERALLAVCGEKNFEMKFNRDFAQVHDRGKWVLTAEKYLYASTGFDSAKFIYLISRNF